MTQDEMMEIFQAAIMLAFKLAVPILLVAMIVGLVIAILQAATQVHEQTLSFAPKAVAVGLALFILAPWMTSECIDFVRQFNDTTFDSEKAASLSTYMEKTTGDNTTLQYVTLNNSLNQVSWAEFHGTRLTTPVPSVKEITPTYNVIVLDYVVTRVGQNGQSEYYNVEEYYRVRYTNTRMYLLNFERTMEEIFRGENDSISGNSILLGIRSKDVEYQTCLLYTSPSPRDS